VTNRAILLRTSFQRNKLPELKDANFTNWAKVESLAIARDVVYEKGGLKTGSTLTQACRDKAKELGERSVALAGYRLADLLVKVFDYSGIVINSPPEGRR
jgi:hypothetical protein